MKNKIKIKKKDIERVEKAIEKLDNVMFDIQKYCPDAFLFFEAEQWVALFSNRDIAHHGGYEQEQAVGLFKMYSNYDCGGW